MGTRVLAWGVPGQVGPPSQKVMTVLGTDDNAQHWWVLHAQQADDKLQLEWPSKQREGPPAKHAKVEAGVRSPRELNRR